MDEDAVASVTSSAGTFEAMLGHTFQPEFFPVMPVMMKASRNDTLNAASQSRSIPAAPSQPSPGDLRDSPDQPALCAQPSACVTQEVDVPTMSKPTIFVCQHCHI